jgi:branched-chain amino acid transport system ATP-binding protein
MLEVKGLCKHFGGIRAVDDCNFTVERGSITALIGPNGAGKTTAFNCISRTTRPTSGEVWLDGERIDQLRPHRITRLGLSRTFQISRNLADMTVLENVIAQSRVEGWRDLFKPAMSPSEIDKAMGLLDFLGITRIAHEDGSNLSYGQKKLMDLAALLMSDPKIILLDEPAGGLNHDEVGELGRLIKDGGRQVGGEFGKHSRRLYAVQRSDFFQGETDIANRGAVAHGDFPSSRIIWSEHSAFAAKRESPGWDLIRALASQLFPT